MIGAKLIELIEIHASQLSRDIARDLHNNERTRGFRTVSFDDLTPRLFQIVHHLGNWVGDPSSINVRNEFMTWGARRFDQKIPLADVVYAVIVLKQHLRRYIVDHGLVEASFPRVEQDFVLPMHLHSLQELNGTVNEFFDEALYYLALGYETAQAARSLDQLLPQKANSTAPRMQTNDAA
jgi:hypothetical protein